MVEFTAGNTHGFTRMELQRLNEGFEIALGAIQHRAVRHCEQLDLARVRRELADVMIQLFAEGQREFSSGSIARDALTKMGYAFSVLQWPKDGRPIGHIEVD